MIVESSKPELPEVLFIDFDGVLTDNTVIVNELGQESVRCNRGDGLAFDAIKKLSIPTFIVSTEKNPVVSHRARKLKVNCLQGQSNKADAIASIMSEQGFNPMRACYIGNDINDFNAMRLCGCRVAPADSHQAILGIATIRLATYGGKGVMRELLEQHFNLNLIEILYP
ncbi:MAG: KdsC family phosphatase [Aestuariibacter sp.]